VCHDGVVKPFKFVSTVVYPSAETTWADAVLRQADEDINRPSLNATIQAVLEPLKVRVISKGNAAPYFLAKRFQVELHSLMRKYPFFRLIGRRLCPTDLFDLRSNKIMGGEGPYGFASIDFSAATDNLSAGLSEDILDELTLDFPPWWRHLLKQCLAPHYCEYPKTDGVTLEGVQQMNGQLMGSIVSFLVLCLANAGVTLAATAVADPADWYSRLKGVLINGDDNGFVCRKSVYETFSRWATLCGLEMSVGKAYWHPKIFNINSECFHFDLVDPRSTPKVIPYLNTGLFFGQGKVLAKTDEDSSERRMVDVIDQVVNGALPGRGGDLLSEYIRLHRDEIRDECAGRNLFIPIGLGGIGCQRPYGWHSEVTFEQQALAGKILSDDPFIHLGFGPQIAETAREVPVGSLPPWQVKTRERRHLDDIRSQLSPHRCESRGNHWFTNSHGKAYRPLRKTYCLQAPTVLVVRRQDGARYPYRMDSRESDFLTTLVQGTAGTVYSLDELALCARRDFTPCVVQHRNRDHSIQEDASPWATLGRSLELDIEMDYDLDSCLGAIRHYLSAVEQEKVVWTLDQ
jgi:hypothetical protein